MTRGAIAIVVTGAGRPWRALVPGAGGAARRAARAALAAAACPVPAGGVEIGIVLACDNRVRALNRAHRGHDRPTNVLSFPIEDSTPAAPARGGPRLLGDVILARETLAREARAERRPAVWHFSHLVVHGILHLLGFDHETEADAARMEAAERIALANLGLPDPYGRA